ncbi:MAG: poly(A) polymerase [Chloroflexi bacterium]|nr:MAG: poly(A) polymerase [Chloroflexota bacterium]
MNGPLWSLPYTPTPPDWRLDWNSLLADLPWLHTLSGVPQDPVHHAEGDVLTHTHLVVDSLVGTPAWRALPEQERATVFAAALLHDIAKPPCTQIAADGRVTSPGHARLGTRFVHKLLWGDNGMSSSPPLAIRAEVAGIVRHHGLPLWFLEKQDPARAVISASQVARLDHVAIVAESDVHGRICTDFSELLERVELFGSFCHELTCWDRPRAFASDHSRLHYFRTPGADPNYAAFDDTVCTVTLMAGLPGAGKDTWIHEHMADIPVIALDDIRRELGIGATGNQGKVVMTAKARARNYLRRRQSFIWNATNIIRALRSQLVDLFTAYHARVRIVYIEAPFATVLARNQHRQYTVPQAVIEKLAGKLELPDPTEAHEVIWIEQ